MSCADYIGEFKPQASNATVIESICRGSNPNYTGSNWFNFWSLNNGTICTSEFSNILYNSFNTVNNPNKNQNSFLMMVVDTKPKKDMKFQYK